MRSFSTNSIGSFDLVFNRSKNNSPIQSLREMKVIDLGLTGSQDLKCSAEEGMEGMDMEGKV